MRIRVGGRVQGVGFRAFVRRTAMRLGLRGWVRNLRDGSVEVVAFGPEEALRELERECRVGPPLARVEWVRSSPEPGEGEGLEDFSIVW